MRDFNFPKLGRNGNKIGVKFPRYVQRTLFDQFVSGTLRKAIWQDLIVRNEAGKVHGVLICDVSKTASIIQ